MAESKNSTNTDEIAPATDGMPPISEAPSNQPERSSPTAPDDGIPLLPPHESRPIVPNPTMRMPPTANDETYVGFFYHERPENVSGQGGPAGRYERFKALVEEFDSSALLIGPFEVDGGLPHDEEQLQNEYIKMRVQSHMLTLEN